MTNQNLGGLSVISSLRSHDLRDVLKEPGACFYEKGMGKTFLGEQRKVNVCWNSATGLCSWGNK